MMPPPVAPQPPAPGPRIITNTVSVVALGHGVIWYGAFAFFTLAALFTSSLAVGLGAILTWVSLRSGAAPRAWKSLMTGAIVGALFPLLVLALVGFDLINDTIGPLIFPVLGALIGLTFGAVALLLLRRAAHYAQESSLDGPDQLLRFGGLWLMLVSGFGLCLSAAHLAIAQRHPIAIAPAIAMPLIGLLAGLITTIVSALRLRRREHWFERVLEGQEQGWDIRSPRELENTLGTLRPLFGGADDNPAVLVKVSQGPGQEPMPFARVPWTVPSRVSYPPPDPNAAGPPITTDIKRR